MKKEEKKSGVNAQFLKWFSELSNKDVAIAGGKGASLAEMANNDFPYLLGLLLQPRLINILLRRVD